MEAQKKMLNHNKNDKRSPLQNLNALHFHKSNSRKPSSLSSSSSVESRNGCLRFLRSSNSSSDASLSSSSSRTHLDRKPKSLPKIPANVAAKPFRSKENELPKKPFSEKTKKKQQLCLDGRENGKSKTNPVSKTAQRSKLSRDRVSPLRIAKKGCEGSEGRKLNPDEPPIRSFTPTGSLGVRRNAAKNSDPDSATANGGSATSAKTPPVEASLSPEIQSKTVVSKSAATPVCYGAGHLLSGVTDKRKCRRRGSLRGACEKINLFDDEMNDKNVDCFIPLPAEASVRWLLSPCNEEREDQGSDLEINLEECEMSCGNASNSVDLLSSAWILSGNASELGCDSSDFRDSPILDDSTNAKKTGFFMPSLQENHEFEMGNLDKKMGENSFLSNTPNSISNCISASENSLAVSLSSGNIVQTPNSDSSSYEYIRRSHVEGDERSFVPFELDSETKTLDAACLSSRSEISMFGLDSSCHRAMESLRLSRMRISWRDGVGSGIDENDELDELPCLSDEEIDGVGCCSHQLKPFQGDEENIHKENESRISALLHKEESLGERTNPCAESICTNGGDLAISCDSDWANMQDSCL